MAVPFFLPKVALLLYSHVVGKGEETGATIRQSSPADTWRALFPHLGSCDYLVLLSFANFREGL
jgi:hypothetical protein